MKNIAKMETGKILDVSISSQKVIIQKSNILGLLGYEKSNKDMHVDEVIESCIAESKNLINPQGCILAVENEKISFPEGKLFIKGVNFDIGNIIASQIRQAEISVFFLCTIGNTIERIAKEKMNRGDLLEGYVLDLIGSEAVEEVATIVHEFIKEKALQEKLKITNRYSPGYCNWDVKEQFKLFGLFHDTNLNIKLTDSALMNPIKSVSGLIGVGENVAYKSYTCSICSDKKCIYRNRKPSHS